MHDRVRSPAEPRKGRVPHRAQPPPNRNLIHERNLLPFRAPRSGVPGPTPTMDGVKAWVVREWGGPESLHYEDVEAGESGDGGIDGGADLCGVAELGAKGGGLDAQFFQIGNRLPGFGFGVAEGDGDGGSGFRQGESECAPDALCRAGDEGDLTFERARSERRNHGLILNPYAQATLVWQSATSRRGENILQ